MTAALFNFVSQVLICEVTTGSAHETAYVNKCPPQVAQTGTSAQLSPTSSQKPRTPSTPGGKHKPRRGAPAAPRQLVNLRFITTVHTHRRESPDAKEAQGYHEQVSPPAPAPAPAPAPTATLPSAEAAARTKTPSGPGRRWCWAPSLCGAYPGGPRPTGLYPLLNASPAGNEHRTLGAPPPTPPGAAATDSIKR